MKFLFAGLGSIGQRHLRNLRTLMGGDCEVLAYRARGRDQVLTDRMQLESGTSLASKYGVQEFTDLGDALSQEPDVAFITNPTRFHIPVAIEAARAGCHLFIEKPLSDSESGLTELQDTVASAGLVAMVGFQFRFDPCLLQIKAWLEQGRAGHPVAAGFEIGEYLPNWHPYEDYRESYASRKELGGGAITTQTHELDCALWLFGMPSRVFALGGHLSNLEVDVEDTASMVLGFPTARGELPVQIHLDYLRWPPVKECTIVGDEGQMSWEYHGSRATLTDRATGEIETKEYPNIQRNQLFLDELNHFLACVRGEATPMVGLEDGAKSLRMALAAKRSMETGQVVEL